MTYLTLAIIWFILSFWSIIIYFRTIPKNKVPKNTVIFQINLVIGMILVVSSMINSLNENTLLLVLIILISIIPIFLGSFILWILNQSQTPLGDIQVSRWNKIIPFKIKTSDGDNFSTEQFTWKRILLKFFRWSWCPYCSAEIKMLNQIQIDLKKFDIEVIALSWDTIKEANTHKKRDNINFTLLANPDLSVIKKYGLEHHKAFWSDSKDIIFSFAWIPFTNKVKFKSMSIPTSILIDENWIIQWIDQTDDYRLRSSKQLIINIVKDTFNSSI